MSNQIYLTSTATTTITKFHNCCCVKKCALVLLLLVLLANMMAVVTATMSTLSMDVNSQATAVDLKGKLVFAHVVS